MRSPNLAIVSLVFAAALLGGCEGCTPPAAVECGTDSECLGHPYGKNRCEPTSSVCVECFLDEQCEDGICLPDGRCGQCDGDEDCAAGSVCASNHCVPACSDANGSCPSGLKCLPGAETCVECVGDKDCGPGRVCSAENTCVPGCSPTHTECPDGLVCSAAKGQCVPCTQDSHCPESLPVCDLATNTCVVCTENADCANPQAPLCDPSSNTCVGCLSDANCTAGNLCVNNACVPGCSGTKPCPSGQQCQLPQGQCVQCVDNSGCGGATPFCLTSENRCVTCLPGAQDTCPQGSYCRADNVCEQGCKTGADCPSGVCLSDHSCQACTSDSQCSAGKVCDNGTCVAACSDASPCGSGRTCCGGHCVDAQKDTQHCGACGVTCGAGQTCCGGTCTTLATVQHCGACGVTCGAGQTCCGGTCTTLGTLQNCGGCGQACAQGSFCNGNTCHTPTYPNFCQNPNVWVIYDGVPIDDAAANVMASTITAFCPPSVTVQFGQQTNPALVSQTTGQPLTGSGSTLVLAGGPWPNKPVKWLEMTQKVTGVYFQQDGVNYYFRRRSDGSVVSQMTGATCSPHVDQFLVHLVTDPASGTLALIGYGACPSGYGTQAAGYYYANVMLPNRQNYPTAWYVVSWSDTNNDSVPNGGDTFSVIASGN